uniref:DDE_Tnp_1_7 domain-containing protein n=1 Tax=Strongyloides papillosus TaxID=174720 RepID=A0A0N5BII3_STREA
MLNVTKGSYNIFLDKSVLTTNVSVMSERISSPTVQKSSLSTSTPLSSSTPLSTTQLGNKSSIYDLSDVYIEDVLKINNDSTGNKSSKTSIVTQDKKNLSLDNTSEKLMKSGLTLNHNDGNILSSHFKFNNLNIGKITEKIQYNNLIKKKFDGTFFLDFLDFSNKYGYLYHVYALFNDPIVKQEIKRLTKATTLDTAKLLSIDSILNTSSVHSLKKIAIFHKDELFQDKIGSNYKSSNTTENSTYKNLKDKLHEMSISIVLIDKNVNIDELEMVLKISKNLKQESFVGLQENDDEIDLEVGISIDDFSTNPLGGYNKTSKYTHISYRFINIRNINFFEDGSQYNYRTILVMKSFIASQNNFHDVMSNVCNQMNCTIINKNIERKINVKFIIADNYAFHDLFGIVKNFSNRCTKMNCKGFKGVEWKHCRTPELVSKNLRTHNVNYLPLMANHVNDGMHDLLCGGALYIGTILTLSNILILMPETFDHESLRLAIVSEFENMKFRSLRPVITKNIFSKLKIKKPRKINIIDSSNCESLKKVEKTISLTSMQCLHLSIATFITLKKCDLLRSKCFRGNRLSKLYNLLLYFLNFTFITMDYKVKLDYAIEKMDYWSRNIFLLIKDLISGLSVYMSSYRFEMLHQKVKKIILSTKCRISISKTVAKRIVIENKYEKQFEPKIKKTKKEVHWNYDISPIQIDESYECDSTEMNNSLLQISKKIVNEELEDKYNTEFNDYYSDKDEDDELYSPDQDSEDYFNDSNY